LRSALLEQLAGSADDLGCAVRLADAALGASSASSTFASAGKASRTQALASSKRVIG